jgi:hypothetical protein
MDVKDADPEPPQLTRAAATPTKATKTKTVEYTTHFRGRRSVKEGMSVPPGKKVVRIARAGRRYLGEIVGAVEQCVNRVSGSPPYSAGSAAHLKLMRFPP